MGLLDVVNVCTSCKKVLVQMAGGKCPDCGGDTISLSHTPKSWNNLTDEQKQAVIEKAFQKRTFHMKYFIMTINYLKAFLIMKNKY